MNPARWPPWWKRKSCDEKNILKLKGFSLSGVAVISAILGAENIENSAKNLLTSAKEIFI